MVFVTIPYVKTKKNVRMTIGPKLALTFAIGLAIPAVALGITLSYS